MSEEKDPDFSPSELNNENPSLSSQNQIKHLWCYLKWAGLSFDFSVFSQMDLTPLGLYGSSGCLRKQGRGRPEGKIGWERGNTIVCL